MEPYLNILYVDDEIHNLHSFKACFRKSYNVLTASSANEAIIVLKTHPIHLIITDQRMPGTTGIEFLESIINEYSDPLRILLTGYSDISAVIDAINKGHIYRYIQKPWVEDELRLLIKEALEHYTIKKRTQQREQDLEASNKQMEFLLRQSLLS